MADKISMSQRVLPKVSQRYIPHNVTFKNDRNGLHFMTGASLRLGPGNNFQIPDRQRVNNMPLCGVHRLGKTQNERPRPIIVRFTCRADRDHVWSQRRPLAESNIRMGEDLPFHVREIRKNILVPALKKAQKTEGVRAFIVADKLVINGRPYTFNKIPSKWRPDQPQLQQSDIHAQNAAAVDLPIAHETG